ncbi:hypothetical protein [Streptomyces sp. SP18CS02]|uniref:hypothetical protein n=1 Tax=Streptomyces sp. SP18CS02 TaxID=3002531 RepID=UPI002E75CD78|nr:hypothetical protein [Streptomyces sp. SP18CS02]MEE1756525.1 hypothetical protein [Streptomyces sp. SP18CS02]
MNVRKVFAASAAALFMVAGMDSVAFAATEEPEPTVSTAPVEEGTVQPEPPEELEDGSTPAPEEEAPLPPEADKPTGGTHADRCDRRNVYTSTKKNGKVHQRVGAKQANYNGTSRTARSWFKSETSGEVGVAVTGELKVSANALIAEIEGKYAVELSAKVGVRIGNEMQVDTPPRKTTYAQYGVWRLKVTGKSYTIYRNCRTSPQNTVVSHTPWHVGWYIWER